MAHNPTASEVTRDQELLHRLGYGVLDVQSESGVGFEDVRRYTYLVEPELSPRATAVRLQRIFRRPFTEPEARAVWDEILKFKVRRLQKTGEDLSIEQAAREWDAKHGFAFRRRWYLTRPEVAEHRYVPTGRERGAGAVEKVTGVILPELRPLLTSGFGVVDVLLHAVKEPVRSLRLAIRKVPTTQRQQEYVRLVADLTGWKLSPQEAEQVWARVLEHKLFLSQQLGTNVPIERAVVDYFKRLRLSGLDRDALWSAGIQQEEQSEAEEPAAAVEAPEAAGS